MLHFIPRKHKYLPLQDIYILSHKSIFFNTFYQPFSYFFVTYFLYSKIITYISQFPTLLIYFRLVKTECNSKIKKGQKRMAFLTLKRYIDTQIDPDYVTTNPNSQSYNAYAAYQTLLSILNQPAANTLFFHNILPVNNRICTENTEKLLTAIAEIECWHKNFKIFDYRIPASLQLKTKIPQKLDAFLKMYLIERYQSIFKESTVINTKIKGENDCPDLYNSLINYNLRDNTFEPEPQYDNAGRPIAMPKTPDEFTDLKNRYPEKLNKYLEQGMRCFTYKKQPYLLLIISLNDDFFKFLGISDKYKESETYAFAKHDAVYNIADKIMHIPEFNYYAKCYITGVSQLNFIIPLSALYLNKGTTIDVLIHTWQQMLHLLKDCKEKADYRIFYQKLLKKSAKNKDKDCPEYDIALCLFSTWVKIIQNENDVKTVNQTYALFSQFIGVTVDELKTMLKKIL